MSNEIDYDEILSKYKSDPYDYVEISAAHTGVVRFQVEKGAAVDAPGGEWMHIDQIMQQVAQHGTRYVCVTGGEPLAQKCCLEGLYRLLIDSADE